MKIRCFDIDWDLDKIQHDTQEPPAECILDVDTSNVPIDDLEDYLADTLSNEYVWRVRDFKFDVTKKQPEARSCDV